ncbi:MAG TPA: LLM class flavin-dependent oxidoreductase [Actinomycetota bacterium]|nr:LLM class flavin-dependent oxidoreductase [Actinomycetota bacterium]
MDERTFERPTGFAIRDPLPWADLVEVVATGEQTGYGFLFLPETTGRDAFATLAGLAGHTSTLRLGTGVVTAVSRRAASTGMAAATVQELSGGRLILGLGTGPPVPGALGRLRELVLALRRAFSGERVETSDGERFRLDLPLPASPPIWIAALGPGAARLAGEVADGVLLNWCPPERVAWARERVREGAERAGRDPSAVTVAVYVRACVGQDPEASLLALRRAAGQYASYPAYRRQFEAVGLGEEARAAAAAFAAGRPAAVPEVIVRRCCLLGGASECSAGLDGYRNAGADVPVVYPVPVMEPVSSIMGTLFALAPHPAVSP